jgi:hypothetical protein
MRATERGIPKMVATARATMTAVRDPPGRMSNPRPKAVREITRSEIPVPPWNRIRETRW